MNTKYIYGALAVAIILIVAFVAFNQNADNTQTADNTNVTDSLDNDNDNDAGADATTPSTTTPNQTTPEPTQPDGNDVAVFEIAYNGTSFSPAQLTINNGDIVVFKNTSDKSFWPASGPHPSHTNYPEFDPKQAITPGQTWQFKFTKIGEWPFHDHLNASVFGKITVR